MDLTFQVPMQYYSFQYQTLLHHQIHPQLSTVSALTQSHQRLTFFPELLVTALHPCSVHTGQLLTRGLIFHCHSFLPFHTVHGVLYARIPSRLPFSSPVDCILLELFTVVCLFWVALQGMAHSLIELGKHLFHNKTRL